MSQVAPPPVINSARVVEYAIIEDADPFTGSGAIYVSDKLLGRVPRLALCENLGTDLGPLLFHCDEAWSVLGVSGGETFEDARQRAERRYPGVSSKWKRLNVSVEEALTYYDRETADIRCAFCERRPFEMSGFIESRKPGVNICRECVLRLHDAFELESTDGG